MDIKIPRLDSVLKDNELREYLAGKSETGTHPPLQRAPRLEPYHQPLGHTPQITLISPVLSVPRYMQKRCIPPLGLCYIAAMLEKENIPVRMIDCCVEGHAHEELLDGFVTYGLSIPQLIERMLGTEPDVIGISVLYSSDLDNALAIAAAVKRAFPSVPIVMGGLHPTIYPKEVLTKAEGAVDWVIRGEGEYRFLNFVRNLEQGLVDVNADGLAGMLNGKLICNTQIETIADLDALPFPAYHLLPMERYFAINVPFATVPKGDRVMQIITSRGCPIGCSFCASTNLYKQYRTRSVQNVVAELEQLKERYAIDEIQFADDNLTLAPDRTRDLMAALAIVGLQWCTPNGTMVNTLNPDLIRQMKLAGLYQLTFSIDSGMVKALKQWYHKPVNLSKVPELVALCQELGIWTHGTLVIGMPGEPLEDIQEGLAYVMEHLPFTSISTFIAQPIPGSELYHQALEASLVDRTTALRSDTTRCRLRLSAIDPRELERLAEEFQIEFTRRAQARDPEAFRKKYRKYETGRPASQDSLALPVPKRPHPSLAGFRFAIGSSPPERPD